MMEAKDFRLRSDPGPEYPWVVRIVWQHSAADLTDGDLLGMRGMVYDIHDATAMQNP